jgi:UDP-galactopyranose mutase
VISTVGRELYEKFFRGYTRKQWGVEPSQLDKAVTARIPVRTNTDDRYFTDRFQFMPKLGYTRMFAKMLAHPNIHVMLQTDYAQVRHIIKFKNLIFTGKIDEYFNYRFGHLPYRSLQFEHVTLDKAFEQPVAVVNYPQDRAYTRSTEYKHLTGQAHLKTALSFEYPCDGGDPYYPVPREENKAIYRKYEAIAKNDARVKFVGRLGTYQYYNMDQVVGQALATVRRIQLEQSAALSVNGSQLTLG